MRTGLEVLIDSDLAPLRGGQVCQGLGGVPAYGGFGRAQLSGRVLLIVEQFESGLDGARIAGPGNIKGVRAWEGAGYAGNFYALTCGLTWRPNANLTFRPEVRWDWYDGEPSAKQGFELPFNDGEEDDQFLFAVDAIVTF